MYPFIPSLLERIYWFSEWGHKRKQNLESFDSEDSSSIQNSKQRCGIAFDILYWMLGTVLGASLDLFHSDGCYATCQKIM